MDAMSIPPTIESLTAHIISLESNRDSALNNWQAAKNSIAKYTNKIVQVRNVILDYHSLEGEISDELAEIARILDIELTKTIVGQGTIRFSFSAEVPIDFDENVIDFDVHISHSFDADDSYIDIDDTDWTVN